VYAAPTTSTTYALTVVTNLCTSNPLNIPVTVANPVGTVSAVSNSTACEGQTITFNADANAGNPLVYQWEVSTNGGTSYTAIANGGVYSGATTNTLTITGITPSLNGHRYRLVVSVPSCNSSVTSNAGLLTVNAKPVVTVSAAPFTQLYPGLETAIKANVTPSSASTTYQWSLNGVAIPGATASTYIANIDGLGEYTVAVNDPNSCSVISSNSVTITDSLNTSLFIYPNPNNGVFQVRYNNKNDGVSNPRFVTIYDAKGARVYRKSFTVIAPYGKMDIDMRRFSKGVYFIELNGASGERLQSERVIIF
jgi:hypothetical protein